MKHLQWLVIGGGLHGVHLAVRLVGEAGIDAKQLALLDPADRLLDRWLTFTAATGMTHLRSAGVHHLDIEPSSLNHMAGNRRQRPVGLMRGRYDRPSLPLFNAHCDRVIKRFDLATRHLRGHATHLEPGRDGVHITLCDGRQIEAQRVVLAMGAGCQPEWPSWAPKDSPCIQHIFEGGKRPVGVPNDDGRRLVVGGGISAAQVALRHVAAGKPVTLVSRHRFRVHYFDSDPGWLGPKLMPTFRRVRDPNKRRHMLHEARHRGSVTPEVHQSLRAAMASNRLDVRVDDVSGLQVDSAGLRLELASGEVVEGTHLDLATGFAGRRPGGTMVDQLVEEYDLPCAACGYPVVDGLLRWHPRIHVSGPLAELELGPVARNIAGARRAGDRLVQVPSRLQAAA